MRAARNLAARVKIQRFERLNTKDKGEGVEVFFVGPAGVDLAAALSAPGWQPGPSPSNANLGVFTWVVSGTASVNGIRCDVGASVLRPEDSNVAIELTKQQQQAVSDGVLQYLEVDFYCGGRIAGS